MNTTPEMSAEQRCAELAMALDEYRAKVCPTYDEVVNEVIERAAVNGDLGKADLGALLLWKRIRAGAWAKDLLCMAETKVREITREAVAAARKEGIPTPEAAANARAILANLDGMKNMPPFASAVIYAAAPTRMAVYDYRAHHGLWRVGLALEEGPGLYHRYMKFVEQCRAEQRQYRHEAWIARDIDLALFQYGKERPRTFPWRARGR